jgi:hypothetical protein
MVMIPPPETDLLGISNEYQEKSVIFAGLDPALLFSEIL